MIFSADDASYYSAAVVDDAAAASDADDDDDGDDGDILIGLKILKLVFQEQKRVQQVYTIINIRKTRLPLFHTPALHRSLFAKPYIRFRNSVLNYKTTSWEYKTQYLRDPEKKRSSFAIPFFLFFHAVLNYKNGSLGIQIRESGPSGPLKYCSFNIKLIKKFQVALKLMSFVAAAAFKCSNWARKSKKCT